MSVGATAIRRWLRDAIDAVCSHDDRLARVWYRYGLERDERRHAGRPVIVYQMGKVGSTTVRQSLAASHIGRKVYHTHTLHPELNESIEQQRKEYPPEHRTAALQRVWRNQYLYERVAAGASSEPWKVITLVREPVARNIGTFFQHVEVLDEDEAAWHVRALSYEFELTVPKGDLEPLARMFFERCRHDQALNFFDREFKGLWGIDVFAEPFPKEQGFQTYGNGRMDVLLLRLEDLNRCGAQALGDFLKRPPVPIVSKNVGGDKPYAELYSLFKKRIELPGWYLDKMYGSRLATHFYTPAELERFRERWSYRKAS
jgi:hypothetical protein